MFTEIQISKSKFLQCVLLFRLSWWREMVQVVIITKQSFLFYCRGIGRDLINHYVWIIMNESESYQVVFSLQPALLLYKLGDHILYDRTISFFCASWKSKAVQISFGGSWPVMLLFKHVVNNWGINNLDKIGKKNCVKWEKKETPTSGYMLIF